MNYIMYRYIVSFVAFVVLCFPFIVIAQQPLQVVNILPSPEKLAPPRITVFPPSISNKEILYLGGVADPHIAVIIFIQREKDSIVSARMSADDTGTWFYTHKGFLSEGNYNVWARVQNNEGELSDPTEPIHLSVVGAAIEIGSYRIGFQRLYSTILGLMSVLIVIFVISIVILRFRLKRKHERLHKEVLEVHRSVKSGFDILKDDIHKELAVLRSLEHERELTSEEKARQAKLLADLDFVARFIEKDIITMEKLM